MGDLPRGSCPSDSELLNTTKRTSFGRGGGPTIYGWPSSGGVLIKDADIADMRFLSLDRFRPCERSSNVLEEDAFCALLWRVGATWWESELECMEVKTNLREETETEKRVLVFGWPSDGVGVWVLRFKEEWMKPRDFGKVHMAVDIDERVQVMREYGAVFYGDVDEVVELREGYGSGLAK